MGLLSPLKIKKPRVETRKSTNPRASIQETKNLPLRRTIKSASGVVYPIPYGDAGLEYAPQLRGGNWIGTPQMAGIAYEMLRDTHVRAAYALRVNPIVTGLWYVEPGGPDPESKKCAAALEWNIKQLPWASFIEQRATRHIYGASWHEVTAEETRFPAEFAPAGGVGVAFTGLHETPQRSILEWTNNTANHRQLSSITQNVDLGGFSEDRKHPMTWILRVTSEQDGSDPRGFPIARSAYGSWFLKTAFLEFEAIKQERFSVGVPVAKQPEHPHPVNPQDVTQMNRNLAELRANERSFLTLAPGWDLSLFGFDREMTTDLQQSIEYLNRNIFMVFGASFNTLGDSNFGSKAFGGILDEHHYTAILRDAKIECENLENGADGWSLTRRFRDYNFPSAQAPQIRVRNIRASNFFGLAERITTAVSTGVLPPYDALMNKLAEILELKLPENGWEAERAKLAPAEPAEPKTEKTKDATSTDQA